MVIGQTMLKCLKMDEVYGILTDEDYLEALEDLELKTESEVASPIIKPVS